MTIAKTILQQIKTIDARALMAWGAKEFVNTGNGLKFKTSGLTPYKGWVHVKYNDGQDLYEVEFFRIRKLAVRVDKTVDGVYAENLVEVIDSYVG
jgi:hypothetical protein